MAIKSAETQSFQDNRTKLYIVLGTVDALLLNDTVIISVI